MSMDEEDVRWEVTRDIPATRGRHTRFLSGEDEADDFSRGRLTSTIVLGTDEEGEDSL
jgi:hypothetical protein